MAQTNKQVTEPVTAVFTLTVDAGEEQAFEHMMHDVHRVARTYPGHMGVTTLKSPTKKNNYQIVLRFDSATHLENWLSSDKRRRLMEPIQKIAHPESTVKAGGLETWFDLPGQAVIPPPRWKMAITTSIAIYPLSLLYSYFIVPHVTTWKIPVRSLFLPVFAPIILTYLFMPYLTQHVLKRWLYKNPQKAP
jgi:antibiotic biosynthesis monooxygenase (ABM) superfamily enzyme